MEPLFGRLISGTLGGMAGGERNMTAEERARLDQMFGPLWRQAPEPSEAEQLARWGMMRNSVTVTVPLREVPMPRPSLWARLTRWF